MKRDPLKTLRDRMRVARNEIEPSHLPPCFQEAQALVKEALTRLEAAGISDQTIVAAMITELLPRMVYANGAVWASTTLAKLAQSLDVSGPAEGIRQ